MLKKALGALLLLGCFFLAVEVVFAVNAAFEFDVAVEGMVFADGPAG